jgi:predicted ribonuclease YlaK
MYYLIMELTKKVLKLVEELEKYKEEHSAIDKKMKGMYKKLRSLKDGSKEKYEMESILFDMNEERGNLHSQIKKHKKLIDSQNTDKPSSIPNLEDFM